MSLARLSLEIRIMASLVIRLFFICEALNHHQHHHRIQDQDDNNNIIATSAKTTSTTTTTTDTGKSLLRVLGARACTGMMTFTLNDEDNDDNSLIILNQQ